MFSLYGVAGRVFNGPLEQLRRVRPVGGKPRVEALQDAEADVQVSLAWAAAGGVEGWSPPAAPWGRPGQGRPGTRDGQGGPAGSADPAGEPQAAGGSLRGPGVAGAPARAAAGLLGAYREAARPARAPLRTVGELMSRPALTLRDGTSAREAWQALAERRVAQAPVLGASGALVGLVGRHELAPGPEVIDPAQHWQQPVARLMRTPVPAVQAEAGLRETAQALLVTGLPGLPVVDEAGTVLGFLSRTDLLRGVAQDPPLDLWA